MSVCVTREGETRILMSPLLLATVEVCRVTVGSKALKKTTTHPFSLNLGVFFFGLLLSFRSLFKTSIVVTFKNFLDKLKPFIEFLLPRR